MIKLDNLRFGEDLFLCIMESMISTDDLNTTEMDYTILYIRSKFAANN